MVSLTAFSKTLDPLEPFSYKQKMPVLAKRSEGTGSDQTSEQAALSQAGRLGPLGVGTAGEKDAQLQTFLGVASSLLSLSLEAASGRLGKRGEGGLLDDSSSEADAAEGRQSSRDSDGVFA